MNAKAHYHGILCYLLRVSTCCTRITRLTRVGQYLQSPGKPTLAAHSKQHKCTAGYRQQMKLSGLLLLLPLPLPLPLAAELWALQRGLDHAQCQSNCELTA